MVCHSQSPEVLLARLGLDIAASTILVGGLSLLEDGVDRVLAGESGGFALQRRVTPFWGHAPRPRRVGLQREISGNLSCREPSPDRLSRTSALLYHRASI